MGYYFIQISACQWIHFRNKKFVSHFDFVELKQGKAGESLVLASDTETVEILEDTLEGYQIKDSSKKWTWKGQWKTTGQNCSKGFKTIHFFEFLK